MHLMENQAPQGWRNFGAAAPPSAAIRRLALRYTTAAACATCNRYATTAAARAAAGRLCCLARGLRTTEAIVPRRPRLLQRRENKTRLLPPPGAVAPACDEDERRSRMQRRPRFLCLHGFRTSGEILRQQVTGRWPAEVTSRLDLVFPDAPFPADGVSPVAGVFDPPYFEWCQFVGEVRPRSRPASIPQHRIDAIIISPMLKCRNLDRCFSYVEELMAREGPFDGLLGFSQGAAISAVLAGLQEQGLALTGVAKVRYVVVIAGGKIRGPAAASRAFAGKIKCPSLHFIGDDDFAKIHSEELVDAFVDPLVIRHPCGHTVPRLDEKGLQVMLSYLDKIEKELSDHA